MLEYETEKLLLFLVYSPEIACQPSACFVQSGIPMNVIRPNNCHCKLRTSPCRLMVSSDRHSKMRPVGLLRVIFSKKTFKMNPSRTQNRCEKGLSAGGGVEVNGGDEAVAGVGVGLEASRGDQGAEATAGRGFGAVAERGVVVDGKDLVRLKPLTD